MFAFLSPFFINAPSFTFTSASATNGTPPPSSTRSLDEWMTALSKTAGNGWHIDPCGYVRDRDGRCPIVAALYNEFPDRVSATNRADYRAACFDAGFSDSDKVVEQIVNAADRHFHGGSLNDVRVAMLAALGLSEIERSGNYLEFYDNVKGDIAIENKAIQQLKAYQKLVRDCEAQTVMVAAIDNAKKVFPTDFSVISELAQLEPA